MPVDYFVDRQSVAQYVAVRGRLDRTHDQFSMMPLYDPPRSTLDPSPSPEDVKVHFSYLMRFADPSKDEVLVAGEAVFCPSPVHGEHQAIFALRKGLVKGDSLHFEFSWPGQTAQQSKE